MTLRQVGGWLALMVMLAALGAAASAQRGVEGDKQYQAALQKEMVDGDLKSAIEEYRKISTRAGVARDIAAAALVRMAECFQKLGDAQAPAIYERIVRDYSDQAEPVAMALARLGRSTGRDTKSLRSIWTGPNVYGAGNVSADGRYVPFTDQETGDLAVRDLVTGTDTRLTNNERSWRDFTEGAAISRDGSMVAYSWWIDGNVNELRVLPRTSKAPVSPRVLLRNPDVRNVAPLDWSPSGDSLVVQVRRAGGTAEIGLVTVSDGTYQSLKSIDWRGVTQLAVSPDGVFIAYTLPADEQSSLRDVFVISRDGQRAEHRVDTLSAYHVVVGWTPDGKALLFATERAGTMVLSAVSVVAGVPQAAPRVIQPDLGTFDTSLGVTSTGRLLFLKKMAGINAFTSAVDFSSGAVLSPSRPVTDSIVRDHPAAMWSPDGTALAWVSRGRGTPTITIRPLERGVTREISPRTAQIQFPRWTTERFITFQGYDLRGRQGIFGVDVQTGETTLLAGGDGGGYRSWADATPDGRRIVYTLNKGGVFSIVVRDLLSGEDRELVRHSGPKAVSPDGRLVAYVDSNPKASWINVLPINGGTPREVLRVERPATTLGNVEWMPDGRRLVVRRSASGKFDRLIVVPVDGGTPVELPTEIRPIGPTFRIHPDGQRVAFSQGDSAYEVWALENFLPAQTARK